MANTTVGPSADQHVKLSVSLSAWLASTQPHTLRSLETIFEEKSFAIVFVILLSVPALPLPTGGLTHVFEIIAMLLASELCIGRRTIWLPKRWRSFGFKRSFLQKGVPFLIKRIGWLERHTRPRYTQIFTSRLSRGIFGGAIFALTLATFLAPPFSGLDTLPALGCVILSLAYLLEDAWLIPIGLILGVGGVCVEVFLGAEALNFIHILLK